MGKKKKVGLRREVQGKWKVGISKGMLHIRHLEGFCIKKTETVGREGKEGLVVRGLEMIWSRKKSVKGIGGNCRREPR